MPKQNEPIPYEVGETYVFTVHTLHDDLCDLVDDAGLHVYLKHTAGLHITKGQALRCRVTAKGQFRPKVELDEEEALARRFGIMSIPTLILFKDGSEIAKDVGYKNLQQLNMFVENNK